MAIFRDRVARDSAQRQFGFTRQAHVAVGQQDVQQDVGAFGRDRDRDAGRVRDRRKAGRWWHFLDQSIRIVGMNLNIRAGY